MKHRSKNNTGKLWVAALSLFMVACTKEMKSPAPAENTQNTVAKATAELTADRPVTAADIPVLQRMASEKGLKITLKPHQRSAADKTTTNGKPVSFKEAAALVTHNEERLIDLMYQNGRMSRAEYDQMKKEYAAWVNNPNKGKPTEVIVYDNSNRITLEQDEAITASDYTIYRTYYVYDGFLYDVLAKWAIKLEAIRNPTTGVEKKKILAAQFLSSFLSGFSSIFVTKVTWRQWLGVADKISEIYATSQCDGGLYLTIGGIQMEEPEYHYGNDSYTVN
jgi:hypothetical protein